MSCGASGDACLTCDNHPTLEEFNDWKDKHQAKQVDHIWLPTIYQATI